MKTKHDLLAYLSGHIGRDNGAPCAAIARALDITERQVRTLVSELREEGKAVCGYPATGYYIAVDPEDIERTCAFLRARAMHSLVLASRLSNVPLPDLLGQLHLKT